MVLFSASSDNNAENSLVTWSVLHLACMTLFLLGRKQSRDKCLHLQAKILLHKDGSEKSKQSLTSLAVECVLTKVFLYVCTSSALVFDSENPCSISGLLLAVTATPSII